MNGYNGIENAIIVAIRASSFRKMPIVLCDAGDIVRYGWISIYLVCCWKISFACTIPCVDRGAWGMGHGHSFHRCVCLQSTCIIIPGFRYLLFYHNRTLFSIDVGLPHMHACSYNPVNYGIKHNGHDTNKHEYTRHLASQSQSQNIFIHTGIII